MELDKEALEEAVTLWAAAKGAAAAAQKQAGEAQRRLGQANADLEAAGAAEAQAWASLKSILSPAPPAAKGGRR